MKALELVSRPVAQAFRPARAGLKPRPTSVLKPLALATVGILVLVVLGSAAPVPAREGRRLAAQAPNPTLEITIDNFAFSRPSVTVARGTKVTWVNRDDSPHTVTSKDKSFASSALDTGDRFSHTFDKPGTYDYYCSLHPRMTGRVVVE